MPESTIEVLQDNPRIIKELIHCTVNFMVEYSKTYNHKIMEINQQIDAVEEARQKEYKRIKDAMKADIKQQSEQQNGIKNALKLPHGVGSGPMQQNAHLNGVDLRHLFIAYAIFRHQAAYGKGIPETNYTWNFANNSIIRKDGKAITTQENAPNSDLIIKILDKYGTRTKTVHIS